LDQNLGKNLTSPHFTNIPNHQVVWTYRGQIIPQNDLMYLEIHIKEVNSEIDYVNIIGEASLWKDGLRIYSVADIAIRLQETVV